MLPGRAGLLAAAALSIVTWQPVRPGIERTELRVATTGLLAAVRVIALRIDPCRVNLSLVTRTRDAGIRAAWSIDSMPRGAILALNGGQFLGPAPWGWFVHDGVEQQAPGIGPLSMAVTVDSIGRVTLLEIPEITAHRAGVREAIQSYPTLLIDGKLPAQLQPGSAAIDLTHRDTRLALGTTATGAIILAITRFGNAGAGGTLPYGPTIPEMAVVMQRLGATRAVGLDGGLSSQLAWLDAKGHRTAFTNWRLVPLGIVGTSRAGCGR